ncbi:MAG: hypothetical protein K6G22_03655 [Lachnospiraceae bacterium]|nr:hypothetical protein [Lachnospiraceae bacterium]
MRFLFPFSSIQKGSRVAIYGAGEVGYDFYRQLKTSGYAEIVLWVDRQYEWFRRLNLPVDEPAKISSADYDNVIITAENRPVYESIRNDLLKMGVPDNKLVWFDDYTIHENIVLGYEDRDLEEEMKDAVQGDPAIFINEKRLDIVIRYMYALDILRDVKNGYSEGLYRKFIINGCDAKEPTENYISAYFSDYSCKRGIKAFQDSFIRLVHSVNDEGFRRDQFLPVANNMILINGAHRVAAALACKKSIWYVTYPFSGLRYKCDAGTLKELGFTDDEIRTIVECYNNIPVGNA